MKPKDLTGSSLSFLGDAVFTLKVREYLLSRHYQNPNSLQKLSSTYNSAKGQRRIFERLSEGGFFKEEEMQAFKRGRNDIGHVPKSSDLLSYEIASGLEAICGYLYLTDSERLDDFFRNVFEGGIEDE